MAKENLKCATGCGKMGIWQPVLILFAESMVGALSHPEELVLGMGFCEECKAKADAESVVTDESWKIISTRYHAHCGSFPSRKTKQVRFQKFETFEQFGRRLRRSGQRAPRANNLKLVP